MATGLGTPGYYASAIRYHPNLMVHQVVHTNDPVAPSRSLTDTQANDPNALRRPASITVTTPGGAVRWATGAYSYDGAGNVKSIGSHSFGYGAPRPMTFSGTFSSHRRFGSPTSQGGGGG